MNNELLMRRELLNGFFQGYGFVCA